MASTNHSISRGAAMRRTPITDSTERLQDAAERLRRAGLEAERAGQTTLANLCWRKRTEALSTLEMIVAERVRSNTKYRGRRMERLM